MFLSLNYDLILVRNYLTFTLLQYIHVKQAT